MKNYLLFAEPYCVKKMGKNSTKYLMIIAFAFFALLTVSNVVLLAQDTLTFTTITEALNWADTTDIENCKAVKKIIIAETISGSDYSANSEWSKFRTLDETFPNIEAVEILTDQDIPVGDMSGNAAYENSLFGGSVGMNGSNWIKSFSAPNVKHIGECAFYKCKSLTTVNFPLVTSIGVTILNECWALTTVNFPSVITVGDSAFKNCKNLTSANIPLVTTIGNSAFYECWALTTVDFPLVITIENSAFAGCENLTSANIPSVTTIGNNTFDHCPLTTVNFPLVINVRDKAFALCMNLVSATFGIGFKSTNQIVFGKDVFGNNNVLTSKIDLALGKYVLIDQPDLDNKIWQGYIWKSITIKTDGIEEIIKNSTVSIFPNPTVGNATVSFELEKSYNVKIVLCDILGIEQMNIYDGFANEGFFTETIDIGNLPKGVYFLKILIGKDYIAEKIILE